MANEKPKRVTNSTRIIETTRHGNDDYSADDCVLESTDGGATWRTAKVKTLFTHESRLVAEGFVRDWWLERIGTDGMGGF